MATEDQASDNASNSASNSGSLLGSLFSGIGKVVDFFVNDPAFGAAAKQGVDELGAALQAFPDGISIYRGNSSLDPPPASTSILIVNSNENVPAADNGKQNANDGYSM